MCKNHPEMPGALEMPDNFSSFIAKLYSLCIRPQRSSFLNPECAVRSGGQSLQIIRSNSLLVFSSSTVYVNDNQISSKKLAEFHSQVPGLQNLSCIVFEYTSKNNSVV